MHLSLKKDLLSFVDDAIARCGSKLSKEQELLKDVRRMIASGRFDRTVKSRRFEESIIYVVPKEDA